MSDVSKETRDQTTPNDEWPPEGRIIPPLMWRKPWLYRRGWAYIALGWIIYGPGVAWRAIRRSVTNGR